MKKEQFLYGGIGVLVGSLITVLFVTNTINTNNYGMMQMLGIRKDINTSSPMANNLNQHFIEQMIPHHEGAIEMAKLAQERSKRSEILKLADTIIQTQSKEIIQMQVWYKNWYGTEVPVNPTVGMGMGRGMMHGGMMGGQTADIESLKNTTNFDDAFLQEMIPHHQMAVMMAQMLLSGTNRPEMKQLAQDIIKAQEMEINQMRSWLREWSL
ncbi:MAG: DUF305 domain-containing protein [Candidatus Pacebacteria bacterium]|nr:DUF305 domain-containing protein [Candidatus Paceibacterota bacterium]